MACQIAIKTKDEAEKLKQRLCNGEDIIKLAIKNGDFGGVKPGQILKPIKRAISKVPLNNSLVR